MKKRIVLHFPISLVDKPVISKVVKKFGLELNILKAEVNPNKEGLLVLEIQGPDKAYKKAIEYLKKTGVGVQPLSKDVTMNRDKCVDCTACVPLCPTSALEQDPETLKVKFIKEKCIACGICIKVCSYGAMNISF